MVANMSNYSDTRKKFVYPGTGCDSTLKSSAIARRFEQARGASEGGPAEAPGGGGVEGAEAPRKFSAILH